MEETRLQARSTGDAASAAHVFAARFGLTLDHLVNLYGDEHWRSSAYGGNPWAAITRSVIKLRDALAEKDVDLADELLKGIRSMRHHTGQLADKLRTLNGEA
jgi:hypothetical protein